MDGTARTLVDTLLTEDPASRREYGRALVRDLGAADARVRWRAAFELATLGIPDAGAVPPLVAAALQDADAGVRAQATAALAVGGRTAAEALVSHLLNGGDHDRTVALLAAIGEPAVAALLVALSSREPPVRWSAVGALEDIAGDHATSALVGALSSADEEVRHWRDPRSATSARRRSRRCSRALAPPNRSPAPRLPARSATSPALASSCR
jgi:HEAT repeat protein